MCGAGVDALSSWCGCWYCLCLYILYLMYCIACGGVDACLHLHDTFVRLNRSLLLTCRRVLTVHCALATVLASVSRFVEPAPTSLL